jgi:hypothetical protein
MKSAAKFVVDRVEAGLAVLALYDDDRVKVNVPLRLLPGATREGDHVLIEISKDDEGRAAAEKRVSALLDELTDKRTE